MKKRLLAMVILFASAMIICIATPMLANEWYYLNCFQIPGCKGLDGCGGNIIYPTGPCSFMCIAGEWYSLIWCEIVR